MQTLKYNGMEVELIDGMGSDLSVVNAARVSFAKRKEELTDNDEGLIKYLATHNHWSPFAHASMQFRIKAPVFVARQLVKHQVGLVWNEVSRRYVDDDPEFYQPEEWRGRAEDKKQGSLDVAVSNNTNLKAYYAQYTKQCFETYRAILGDGVAPEQARMVLPQSMMTEWYWSGTLYAFARVCALRCAKDTQLETQKIANFIAEFANESFPISWKYLS